MPTYVQSAFHAICKEAIEAEGHFLCLMETTPFYGGPEEGGWWGTDTFVVAYQRFDTKEAAEAAQKAVERFAVALENEARCSYGEQCLREMEWCDQHGVDADFLPEPDGPSEFYVLITTSLPTGSRGERSYS